MHGRVASATWCMPSLEIQLKGRKGTVLNELNVTIQTPQCMSNPAFNSAMIKND